MNDMAKGAGERGSYGPAWTAAHWIASARDLHLPSEVVEAARTCLIDWFACAVGGLTDPAVSMIERRVREWSPSGAAPLLTGGRCAPAFAAMFHSTAAHVMDFDDTHIWTDAHFGGPTWAAVLSQISDNSPLSDQVMCRAFVAGFEVGTKLGGRRLGHAMVHRGFQATALLGRISSAAACSVLAELDTAHTAVALTIAGCQTAGLSTTAGTMMKPFQGGKTASDGVIAVELAAEGFTADPALFEKDGGKLGSQRIGGLARALVQDGFAEFAYPDFTDGWQILRNSTKAYPCLHSIGPVVDAARDLAPKVRGHRIEKVRVFVGPSVPKIARYSKPSNAHEGRFSLEYCATLGLLGSAFSPKDFEPEVMNSDRVQEIVRCVEIVPIEGRKMYNAAIDVTLESGELLCADVPLGRGHPGRPLTPGELQAKFCMLVEPVLGPATAELHAILATFPNSNGITRAVELVRQSWARKGKAK